MPRGTLHLFIVPFLIMSTCAGEQDVRPEGETWKAFHDTRLSDGRALRIERQAVSENPRRVNHRYRFTVTHPDGKGETAEWPAVTEFRDGHWKVVHAAWVNDGYLALVMAEPTHVWAWVVDVRPGENRPDLTRTRAETLTSISGLDGPAVSSAAVSGSVGDGSLTIRLFGGTPRGKGKSFPRPWPRTARGTGGT